MSQMRPAVLFVSTNKGAVLSPVNFQSACWSLGFLDFMTRSAGRTRLILPPLLVQVGN